MSLMGSDWLMVRPPRQQNRLAIRGNRKIAIGAKAEFKPATHKATGRISSRACFLVACAGTKVARPTAPTRGLRVHVARFEKPPPENLIKARIIAHCKFILPDSAMTGVPTPVGRHGKISTTGATG